MATSAFNFERIVTVQYNAQRGQIDSEGHNQEDWQPYCQIFAHRLDVKGRLYFEAAAAQKEDDVTFIIYYRRNRDITAAMRIVDGADTLEIKVPPVDTDGTRMYMEVHCREVLENG